ncbi:MAG TPA: MBL fold metallo-hydrolase [Mycobacteriales bacterium]
MGVPKLTSWAASGAPPEVASVVEVADRVYAYVQPAGGWCVNNAGVLVGPEGVVLVDTAATERRARWLAAAVRGLGGGRVHTVINTHHHGDHTFGNHLFSPPAAVVGHELAREEMIGTGLALTRLWPGVDWGDVRVVPPGVTFRDTLTLHLGDRRCELIHVGPAHTTNDVVVWLPADRVLFVGDVALSGCTPFNLMGSIAGSLVALDRLRGLGAKTVVCGHGPVSGPEVLDETAHYLRWIQQVAAGSQPRGITPLQAAREAGLADFAHLLDPERIVGNLHRAYAELGGGELGEPLDVAPVFGEMIEYNGGTLPPSSA